MPRLMLKKSLYSLSIRYGEDPVKPHTTMLCVVAFLGSDAVAERDEMRNPDDEEMYVSGELRNDQTGIQQTLSKST